jgi:hypothetical protein
MIAKQAAEFVARFIDKSFPQDREEIYEIMTLALNRAWNEGKWLGMTAEFFVPVEKDLAGNNFIIAPTTHPILLAVNVNGSPNVSIRDNYFQFHKNGMGSIVNSGDCRWTQDVTDIGVIPIINKHNINFRGGVRIGVRPLGQPGENEEVYIDGVNEVGGKLYTYVKSDLGCACACTLESQRESRVETVNGVKIKVQDGFHYISNALFYDIKGISKTVTRTPIEVIAIDCDNNATVIARIEPNQMESKYRKYSVPTAMCGKGCIHGLYKISKQEKIVNDTDRLILSNLEAIIAFTKGIYMLYYKENLEVGSSFILNGISILEKERREEDSPSEFPVQVTGMMVDDVPEILKYNH